MSAIRKGPSGPSILVVEEYQSANTIYVGKGGKDTNDGLSEPSALLTFGAAITLLQSGAHGVPSSTNRFVLYCEDAGIYQENVALIPWVSMWAPNATIEGVAGGNALEVGDGCNVKLSQIVGQTGQFCILKGAADSAVSRVDINIITVPGGGVGVGNLGLTGGVLMVKARTIMVGSVGFGVGDLSIDAGHIHLDVGDIYLTGNGAIGIVKLGAGSIIGRVDHILDLGVLVGTIAMSVVSGTLSLNVGILETGTAWLVAAGAVLDIYNSNRSGNESVDAAGTLRINGGDQRGTGTLFNGEVTISAVGADTRGVLWSRRDSIGAFNGTLECPVASRTAAAFVVRSLDPATGLRLATDQSTFDWFIPGPQ